MADFGFSRQLFKGQKLKERVGSMFYSAPEVLKGEAYDSKCDVYSIGVVFYELLFSRCPYEERTLKEQVAAIEEGFLTIPSFTNKISKETEQLIIRMLKADPKERISWKELFGMVEKLNSS